MDSQDQDSQRREVEAARLESLRDSIDALTSESGEMRREERRRWAEAAAMIAAALRDLAPARGGAAGDGERAGVADRGAE